jgi:hypothetical protein
MKKLVGLLVVLVFGAAGLLLLITSDAQAPTGKVNQEQTQNASTAVSQESFNNLSEGLGLVMGILGGDTVQSSASVTAKAKQLSTLYDTGSLAVTLADNPAQDSTTTESANDDASATSAKKTTSSQTVNTTVINQLSETAALTVKPETDSVGVFSVKNTAGSTVLSVDTLNQRVGVGTSSPESQLSITATNPQLRISSGSGAATNITRTDTGNITTLSSRVVTSTASGFALKQQAKYQNMGMLNAPSVVPYDTPQFSVSVWVNADGNSSGYGNGLYSLPGTTGGYQMTLYNDYSGDSTKAGAAWVIRGAGEANVSYGVDKALFYGKWALFTTTFDGTTAKMYVNGVLVGEDEYTGTYTTAGLYSLRFGSNTVPGWDGNYLNGSLDEALLYSRALSNTEIMDLYGNGQGGVAPATGLVAGFHLDEGTGSTAADFSGNSNNMTVGNSGWVSPGALKLSSAASEVSLVESGDSDIAGMSGYVAFGSASTLTKIQGSSVAFLINGSQKMVLANNGKFGIGNTAPQNLLSVSVPYTNDYAAAGMIAATSGSGKGLVVQGAASQSASLFETQTYTGIINFSVGASGGVLAKNSTNSTTAFQIQKADGTTLFVADTSGTKITLGAAGATPVLLVLGTKNTSGDPGAANGTLYYNSNTNRFRCYENNGWADCSRGTLGYASVSGSQPSITSEADLAALSVAVNVPSGHRIRISARTPVLSTVANDRITLRIKESTTVLQTCRLVVGLAGLDESLDCSAVFVPAAGGHTYKLSLQRENGTGTVSTAGSTTQPAFIHVEDVGY